jgi:hypothetical protein
LKIYWMKKYFFFIQAIYGHPNTIKWCPKYFWVNFMNLRKDNTLHP